jgi:hypothetical protein
MVPLALLGLPDRAEVQPGPPAPQGPPELPERVAVLPAQRDSRAPLAFRVHKVFRGLQDQRVRRVFREMPGLPVTLVRKACPE